MASATVDTLAKIIWRVKRADIAKQRWPSVRHTVPPLPAPYAARGGRDAVALQPLPVSTRTGVRPRAPTDRRSSARTPRHAGLAKVHEAHPSTTKATLPAWTNPKPRALPPEGREHARAEAPPHTIEMPYETPKELDPAQPPDGQTAARMPPQSPRTAISRRPADITNSARQTWPACDRNTISTSASLAIPPTSDSDALPIRATRPPKHSIVERPTRLRQWPNRSWLVHVLRPNPTDSHVYARPSDHSPGTAREGGLSLRRPQNQRNTVSHCCVTSPSPAATHHSARESKGTQPGQPAHHHAGDTTRYGSYLAGSLRRGANRNATVSSPLLLGLRR